MTSSATVPVLNVSGLSKSFGNTQALRDASIDVAAGEVHVLLGENGAGKSTLAKIVAGIHTADAGHVIIDGRKVTPRNAREARATGVAIVFQDMSLAPHLSVIENLFLGSETGRMPFRALPRRQERKRARDILVQLEIDLPLDETVANLSIGEKQLLEIAKALHQKPRILILDEPTSALTEREKAFLFAMIRTLQAGGTAILYVTHHLREVLEIGNRVSAMRDGHVVRTVAVDERMDEQALVEMLTGRPVSHHNDGRTRDPGAILLEAIDLKSSEGCHNIHLVLREAEIVGIYGVVGSGREALARTLIGMSAPSGGEMRLGGHRYLPKSPADAATLGVGYLAMDRHAQGLLPHRPIRENLTLSNIARHSRFGLISHRQERDTADERLHELHTRFASMEDLITSLSGGNQQKVLFGRAFGRKPKLLIMEEPTAGIDAGAKLDLHRIIRQLAAQGHSFLLFSSDLSETLSLCDRVYTIYRGRFTDEIHHPRASDEGRILAGVLSGQARTKAKAAETDRSRMQ